MVGNIPRVNNPLTVIAIFAGLSEVAMTVSLGLLEGNAQFVFMVFAALFPIAIASGFFFILYDSPELLYAPSDYKDENHHRESLRYRQEIRSERIRSKLAEANQLVEDKSEPEAEADFSTEAIEALEREREKVERLQGILIDLRKHFDSNEHELEADLESLNGPSPRHGRFSSYRMVLDAIQAHDYCTEDEIIKWIKARHKAYPANTIRRRLRKLVELGDVEVESHENGINYSIAPGSGSSSYSDFDD